MLSARAGEEARIEGLRGRRRRLPGQAVLRARAAGARRRTLRARRALQARVAGPQRRRARERCFSAGAGRRSRSCAVPTYVFELANPTRIARWSADRAGTWDGRCSTRCPELRGQGSHAAARPCMQTGRPHVGHEALRCSSTRGGSAPEERYFDLRAITPLRDEARRRRRRHRARRIDVTEQVRARESRCARPTARKDEFLAMLAHELRNPLAPIRNALQLLRMAAQPTSRACERASHEIMERQVKHLVRLVDDLLDVSRITPRQARAAQASGSTLASRRCAAPSRRAEPAHRGAPGTSSTVSLPDEPAMRRRRPGAPGAGVREPAQQRRQVHRRRRQHLAGGAARDGEAVSIAVRDNGIGIAPDMLPHVFDLFSRRRPDALDRTQGGPRHRPDAGATAGRDARRHGRGAQRGTGTGSEFDGPPARVAPAPAASATPVRAMPRRSVAQRASWSSTTTTTRPTAWRCSCSLLGRRRARRLRRRGGARRAASAFARGRAARHRHARHGRLRGGAAHSRRLRRGAANARSSRSPAGARTDDRAARERAGFDHHLVKPVDIAVLQDLLASIHRGAPHPAASDAAG